MKTLVSMFTFIIAIVTASRAQEIVRPSVAASFGKQVVVHAEFVAKPNTYYAQNLVSEPYTLRVLAVDGLELREPVLIEYRLVTVSAQRSKIERLGGIQKFEAYETLYQPAIATPWLPEGEQGMRFVLVHVLNIRVPR